MICHQYDHFPGAEPRISAEQAYSLTYWVLWLLPTPTPRPCSMSSETCPFRFGRQRDPSSDGFLLTPPLVLCPPCDAVFVARPLEPLWPESAGPLVVAVVLTPCASAPPVAAFMLSPEFLSVFFFSASSASSSSLFPQRMELLLNHHTARAAKRTVGIRVRNSAATAIVS
jgi:hypothetical protein